MRSVSAEESVSTLTRLAIIGKVDSMDHGIKNAAELMAETEVIPSP